MQLFRLSGCCKNVVSCLSPEIKQKDVKVERDVFH